MAQGEKDPSALGTVLQEVAERANRLRGQKIGEQNTKAVLIDPVLRALGWNTENVDEVRREYRRRPQDKPVDYALLLNRDPVLFVEAKGLDEELGDRRWASQIISYASVAGVAWVALSDGEEWRIYNAHAPVPVEEKLFRQTRITDDLVASQESLALLAKEPMSSNLLAGLWKADHTDRKVKDAVESLFSPEPSPWLVRRLAQEIGDLTQGEVRAALSRTRLSVDIPSPPTSRPPVSTGKAADGPTPEQTMGHPSPKQVGVSLSDLIGAHLVKPPLELRRTYLDRNLVGRVEADGQVTVEGETFQSPSVAAGFARTLVKGAPPGRKYLQTNGWTFWRFQDGDEEWKELDVLRQRYLERETRAEKLAPTLDQSS